MSRSTQCKSEEVVSLRQLHVWLYVIFHVTWIFNKNEEITKYNWLQKLGKFFKKTSLIVLNLVKLQASSVLIYYTESSKGFERKPFTVLLIIKNHWSFKNTRQSLLSEPLRVALIKNHRLKISLRYVKVCKVMQNV